MRPRACLSLCLAALAAAAAQAQIVEMSADALADKIHGGLLGQILGNLNGLPYEMKFIAEPGQVAEYIPGLPQGARTDDDTDIEWMYILEMQRSRRVLLEPQQINALWQQHVNDRIWCANLHARRLMDLGLSPPLTGTAALNPWSGFNLSGQFLAESFGLIAPAMPRTAGRIGRHYTSVGIEGEPAQCTALTAGMVATAFVESDVEKIIAAGRNCVDPASQVHAIVGEVLDLWRRHPDDWRALRRAIHDRYTQDGGDIRDCNGHELNTAAVIASLLYGKGDFVETMRLAFNFGWDADCNAATAGTVLGVIKGRRWFAEQGWPIADRYENTSRPGLPTDETITRYAERLTDVARMVITEHGGQIDAAGHVRMTRETPAPVERLTPADARLTQLRRELAARVDAGLTGTPVQRACAAYLAVCLGRVDELKQVRPSDWSAAVSALAEHRDLLKLIAKPRSPEARAMLAKFTAAGVPLPTAASKPAKSTDSKPASTRAAERRPNVVFILTDDQRWDALSCAGHPYLKTPNIDRLAAEGLHFRNAFCTTSLCSPSRASILSGLYAHTHGVRDNFTEFPENLPSFPRLLQQAGYATAYIGKWHMGENNDEKRPGFDFFATHKGQGKYFDTEFNVDGDRRPIKGYYTHVVTDLALQWLHHRPADRPFLLMIGHKAPHSFYTPEPKYAHAFDQVDIRYPDSAFHLEGKPDWLRQRLNTWHGIYGPLFEFRKQFPDSRPEAVRDFAAMTRAYWATLLSVDDSVGQVRKALEEAGVLDNTVFIYTGDNGLLNGEHGMVDKRTMHEPSIRVPLVVRAPMLSRPTSGRPIDQMVLTVDLAPTILEACGLPPLPKAHGRSWVPLARGRDIPWRTSWHYEYNYEKQFPYTPNVRGVRTQRWKYIHYPHGDGGPDRHTAELYDLAADPGELHNLIDDPAQAPRIAELRLELARLHRETGLTEDRMPLDEGIKSALPDAAIR